MQQKLSYVIPGTYLACIPDLTAQEIKQELKNTGLLCIRKFSSQGDYLLIFDPLILYKKQTDPEVVVVSGDEKRSHPGRRSRRMLKDLKASVEPCPPDNEKFLTGNLKLKGFQLRPFRIAELMDITDSAAVVDDGEINFTYVLPPR